MTDILAAASRCAASAALIAIILASPARAQQAPAQVPTQVPTQVPAQAPPQQQFQPSGEWAKLPKMILERQFSGPLQDTVIQRLRDPVDGTICYLYLPISAPHSPPTSTGFVQYGPNAIGSINCMAGLPATPAAARKKQASQSSGGG